ncbi:MULTISPECIES: helix-turn-helix domain-containing protein [unclassified Rhodococcus (in: high G+C Gram-positive bacteria)]|uniref:helix-turn-helix domain-containing protein n=1 Tax=unclassified Rhodococcus (in: high G+C Gram-positive bacteria) TaxID=192944 RepID=UPI00163AC442|nr:MULTISPECIES: helix-turn-helix domain-containing protein [unclassified Rhodococcus (in: high G+C Gram-positive bacteria)]MBC2644501.1 helix-turn-helix domain-containing protein [Rhodococcus sp. 3A]MBC2897811.1 helix-turn-helix domain-containing protein [Rhodococcus sp. 4CII]
MQSEVVPDVVNTAELAVAAAGIEVQRLARALLRHTTEIAADVTKSVVEAVPEVAPLDIPDSLAALGESTEHNIGAILSMFAFDAVPTAIEPPAATLRTLQGTISAGGDLATVLRAFRAGHAAVWERWSTYVQRETESALVPNVLAYSSKRLFAYIDGACEQLVTRHRELYPNRGDQQAGPRSRQAALAALLDGSAADERAAADELAYDVHGYHVALVLAPAAASANVREALGALVAAASPVRTFTHTSGDGRWFVWLGWDVAPTPQVLRAVATVATDGVVVGMGAAASGIRGFRRSHAQALETLRTVQLRPTALTGVTQHCEVELAAVLVAGNADRSRRYAAERLGLLGARDESTARLRETLRVFFATGGSQKQTASRLSVHAKTVAYRLARAEELLGHPVYRHRTEVEVALLIDHALAGP